VYASSLRIANHALILLLVSHSGAVQNIRPRGGTITVDHPYTDVLCAAMTGPGLFVVQFVNDADLVYETPVHCAAQLSTSLLRLR